LLSYDDGNSVFCGSALRLYNNDFRPPEEELRESVEMAVKDDRRDSKKGIRLCKQDFCVLQLQ
jgi:hypothetical protein